MGFWFQLLHTKLSYFVFVPAVRNRCQTREVSKGLCKTSNFSSFTFINASDLNFCAFSYNSCGDHMASFKCLNGNVCKMVSHVITLYWSMLFYMSTGNYTFTIYICRKFKQKEYYLFSMFGQKLDLSMFYMTMSNSLPV